MFHGLMNNSVLYSMDSDYVKMAIGCGISHKNTGNICTVKLKLSHIKYTNGSYKVFRYFKSVHTYTSILSTYAVYKNS
jgi:hypothetical protein